MKKNELDVAWERYLKSKDSNDFKHMVNYIKESLDPVTEILDSLYFGELMSRMTFAFKSFMCGNEQRLRSLIPVLDKLSNTQKTAMAEFLSLLLNVREISVNEISSTDLNNVLAESGVNYKRLADFLDYLDSNHDRKLAFFEEKSLPDIFSNQGYFNILGTSFFNACYIRVGSPLGKTYLVGIYSPFDAIFIPTVGLLIKGSSCNFNFSVSCKKLIHAAVRDMKRFCDAWDRKTVDCIINIIKVDRPYHVVADELSGNFHLKYSLSKDYPTIFMERASFFEQEVFDYTPLLTSEMQEFGSDKVLFSAYKKLDNESNWSEAYRQWLINKATELYEDKLFLKKGDQICIWIGIAGGEKRVWKEELDGLVAVIEWFSDRFAGCQFVFDGWTATSNSSEIDLKNIEKHNGILRQIIGRSGLDQNTFKSTIGSQVFNKVALANQCDFFVTCAGTPALWPSFICKVPGVVHNNTQMINTAFKTVNYANVMKVPDDMILDIRDNMRRDRKDFLSYSISPETIVRCCEVAVLKFLNNRVHLV